MTTTITIMISQELFLIDLTTLRNRDMRKRGIYQDCLAHSTFWYQRWEELASSQIGIVLLMMVRNTQDSTSFMTAHPFSSINARVYALRTSAASCFASYS